MRIREQQGTMHRWLLLVVIAVLLGACSHKGSIAAAAKYEANGQYRAAYIESKKVLQRDSTNGMAWLTLGKASLMLGTPQDAINDLQNAKKYGVPQSEWQIPMGRALLLTQAYDTLFKTLATSEAHSSAEKARVEVLQGDAYFGLRQPDKAKQQYQSALSLEPNDPQALVGLAKVAASEKDMDAANDYIKQAIASAPEAANTWIFKGDLAFSVQDFAGAEADYEKSLGVKDSDLLPQQQFYATVRLADAQIQQNKFDQALVNIETLEKMSAEQPYPHFLHAVVLYKQSHYAEAVSQLQQVLKVSPNSEPAQLLMGAVNYAQANYSQADMYLSNVLGLDDKNEAARKLLAVTLYKEGQSHQALQVLRPAISGKPSDAQLMALIEKNAAESVTPSGTAEQPQPSSPSDKRFIDVERAIATGDIDEAIRLAKALPAGTTSQEAQRYTLLVLAYLQDKHPEKAVKTAAEFVNKYPKLSGAHLLHGTALAAAGDRNQARAEYTQAYQLDPRNIAALMSLGSLDVVEKRYKEALDQYQSVLKADPGNVVAMTAAGRVMMALGDRASAMDWFKRAIKAAPKAVDPYVDLIALYTSSGQFDEAISTAKRLNGIAPDNPRALNALGIAELEFGKYKDALVPLQQSVKLAPQVALYRTNLARAQILDGQGKEAEANLEQVNKAAPEDVTAASLLALLKLKNDDMSGALSVARALQTHPQSRVAGLALEGDLYVEKKRYAEALQAFQRGLKLDYIRPLVVKYFMAANASGAKDADRALLTWLDSYPDDAAMRLLLGEYYMNHAQYEQSDPQLQRVIKAFPDNIVALNDLAWVYTLQNNPQAVPLAAHAYKLAPTSASITDTYGWALVLNGQTEKALPLLQAAVKQSPKAPSIRYHLAVAQSRSGDKPGALMNLQTALKSEFNFPERAAAEKLYHELGS